MTSIAPIVTLSLAGAFLALAILAAIRWRPRPTGRRMRSVSLGMALIFGQIFDPPVRHAIEAKDAKRQETPAPGDPPTT